MDKDDRIQCAVRAMLARGFEPGDHVALGWLAKALRFDLSQMGDELDPEFEYATEVAIQAFESMTGLAMFQGLALIDGWPAYTVIEDAAPHREAIRSLRQRRAESVVNRLT